MAENPGTWPSKRGPIAKIVPSDVYKRAAVPFGGGTVVQFLRFRMSSGKCWTNNNYAFSGRLIRLNEEGFDAWATAYHRLDLRAELQALDDYYDRELTGKERKNWYQRCSGALAKKHREARQEPDSVHGTPDSDVIY